VADSASGKDLDANGGRSSQFFRWRAVAINAWIAAVILAFLTLRVFESNTVRRILHSLAAR
jgi:hypothetical protein